MASRTAALFERLAERYDAWYEDPAGRELFAMELACLRPLLQGTTRPRLEVGVGSGRFAAALGVEVGLDPAREPLGLARLRGVRVVQGVGERLPFRDGVFGGVLVVVTLCFADDPQMLLAEARRVLRPGGALVLGELVADSSWGQWYRQRGEAGHSFYSQARFLTVADTERMLKAAGFGVTAARSTLVQPPTDQPHPEPAVDGAGDRAGFVCLQAV